MKIDHTNPNIQVIIFGHSRELLIQIEGVMERMKKNMPEIHLFVGEKK